MKARQARLDAALDRFAGRAAILLVAPAGSGKSALLAHWRRLLIASGRSTIWLPVEPGWDAATFVAALAAALPKPATPPRADPVALADWLCGWLLDHGRAITLLIDDADRLVDQDVRQLLVALIAGLRPGMQAICAVRRLAEDRRHGLIAAGALGFVDRETLRWRPAETIAALTEAAGGRQDAQQVASLAAATGDVPAFVALACAAIGEEDAVAAFEARARAWHESAVAPLLDDRDFRLLRDVALLKETDFDAALAVALSGIADAGARLARLAAETPLVRAEAEGRYRGHPRLAALLPAGDDAVALHRRAGLWLAPRAPMAAIEHLLLGGEVDRACSLVEAELMDAVTSGRVSDALAWLDHIPPAAIAARPDLKMAIGWALAIGGRDEALRGWIETHDVPTDGLLLTLIEGLLACAADDPDLALATIARADEAEPLPAFAAVFGNLLRWIDEQRGEGHTEVADTLPRADARRDPRQFYSLCFAAFRDAEAALDQGRSARAITILAPLVETARARLGPQSSALNVLSVALAAAHAQAGDAIAALAALGPRPVSVESWATPSAVWLAYLARARIARDLGDFDAALGLIVEIERFAEARQLHRIRALALAEGVRLCVGQGGHRKLPELVDALWRLRARAATLGPIRARLVRLAVDTGLANALVAARDVAGAMPLIVETRALAVALGRHRCAAELALLATEIGGEVDAGVAIDAADLAALRRERSLPISQASRRAAIGQRDRIVLTAKEREILELLAAGVSNQQIGKALLVSTETIKWHLKNIFNKLEVHDRSRVVDRARELALID